MEKRLIIAVVLSILIVMSFQFIAGKQPSPPVKSAAVTPAFPSSSEIKSGAAEAKPSYEEKEFTVETGKQTVVFSNVGGAIKSIVLKEYKSSHSPEKLHLVDIKDPREYLLSVSGSLGSHSINLSEYATSKSEGAIRFELRAREFEIVKEYILSKSKNTIELRLFVKNISSAPQDLSYSIIGGAGIKSENEGDKKFVEISSKINEKIGGIKRPKEGKTTIPGIVSWEAMKNKYFSIILKPFVITKNEFCIASTGDQAVIGVEPEPITIQPGAMVEHRYILYAGPGNIPVLKDVGYGFEETVNYGMFGWIAKILLVVMMFIQKLVNSWGVTIILLSVFLNLFTFPLTAKSFKSMQKMQELHPQMEKLKIQHKDNPQKLNQEIMELYKKYNINPLSGCLPMLLQMPIFIALYQVLMKAIELRGANFLWIGDLSMPDAVPIPIDLPIVGSHINILPLVMVGAMVLQQKISSAAMGSAVTEEQRQQQKMMLIVMPIVFGFIFYNMPSGLVLYWVTNTALTMIEQAAILKKA